MASGEKEGGGRKEKRFASCATQLSASPEALSLFEDAIITDVHGDAGAAVMWASATAGAPTPRRLINHTWLGRRCVFIRCVSHIFNGGAGWGGEVQYT